MPQSSSLYEALDKDYTVVMHFDEDWEATIKNEDFDDEVVDKFYRDGFMKNLNLSGAVTPKVGKAANDEAKKKELMKNL